MGKTSIDKSKLEGFISRYYLGGLGKSVIWKFDGKKLITEYATEARTMKGTVVLKGLTYPDAFNLGIFDTEKLIKLMNPLDNECEMKVAVVGEEAKSIDMVDLKGTEMHFMLSALDMIPSIPKAKDIPKGDVSVKLTPEVLDRFIKAANALSEVGTFTFSVKKDKAEFKIGYTSVASNTLAVVAELETSKPISSIVFPTPVFVAIFSANKDATKMSLDVSEKGLAKLEFDSDEYKTAYFAVSTEEAK